MHKQLFPSMQWSCFLSRYFLLDISFLRGYLSWSLHLWTFAFLVLLHAVLDAPVALAHFSSTCSVFVSTCSHQGPLCLLIGSFSSLCHVLVLFIFSFVSGFLLLFSLCQMIRFCWCSCEPFPSFATLCLDVCSSINFLLRTLFYFIVWK